MKFPRLLAAAAALSFATTLSFAQGLDAGAQTKLDAQIKLAQTLAADPVIVAAVKAHNTSLPASSAEMTQDKWKGLSILDPAVRSFTKNPSAELLKARKSPVVTEAFISGADGNKVAFLTKPSNFSHKGKAKHDDPMTGKIWKGDIELDESTGSQQIQFAVPVLDGDKPIGSLVVGLAVSKLKE